MLCVCTWGGAKNIFSWPVRLAVALIPCAAESDASSGVARLHRSNFGRGWPNSQTCARPSGVKTIKTRSTLVSSS
jgi:hypothetical protein